MMKEDALECRKNLKTKKKNAGNQDLSYEMRLVTVL